ncbi:hypothetical protein Lfu02_69300 [Longispora fulva]|nr:hypothetical protein Lfu02_69300 [Longispora fulva]
MVVGFGFVAAAEAGVPDSAIAATAAARRAVAALLRSLLIVPFRFEGMGIGGVSRPGPRASAWRGRMGCPAG